MRLTNTVTLIPPEADGYDAGCQPVVIRGAEAEEAGVRYTTGGLQLIVDEQGVDERWDVRFSGLSYEVSAVVPWLKQRHPRRVLLFCSKVADV